jgi:sigma-B regulation protein RsbU (phosphoserine phosphatase)
MEMKPINTLLDEIIEASKQLLSAEASSLLLYDEETDHLFFHIAKGDKATQIESNFIKMGHGIAGWVADHKEPLKIDDCYSDPRFNPEFDKKTGFITRNMLCVPMIRKGELVGALQVINKSGGGRFSELDLSFFKALSAQCAIAIENARLVEVELKSQQLKYELETAHNIQQKLLPQKLPVMKNISIDIRLIPAKEVGGDYYNVIKINDAETLFFIVDVTGKSIPAALIVSTIYSFIQTYVIIHRESFNLIEFTQTLNQFLLVSTTPDKFASAWFALFNNTNNSLECISAGHNPTYFIRNEGSSISELNAGGIFLGSMDFPYNSETISLDEGDTIVFYTDGITEAMNMQNEEFGEENFQRVILSNIKQNVSGLMDSILGEINLFRGKAEQSDDITCGALKFSRNSH